MAVQPQTPYQENTANGVTTVFPLEFDCENKDHLIVLIDGVETDSLTWSLANKQVTFTIPPALNKKITFQRNTPFKRDRNYQSYDNSFRPDPVNKDFDWLWLKLQELGVADWLLRLYVDQLHSEQKIYIDQKDVQINEDINDLSTHVDLKDAELQENIDNLKSYVDDKDDELRAYLMNEIHKQGVALDQLDDYYNYLMQRLAQIAVDRGWSADFVVTANGSTQQEVNDRVGNTWREKPSGYALHDRVMLGNGEIVISTLANNTQNPNLSMIGWRFDWISYSTFVTPRQFGGKPNDPTFDNKFALQDAINSKKSVLLDGLYYTTEAPYFERGAEIVGLSKETCGIVKVGNSISTLPSLNFNATIVDSYAVDAVLISRGGDYTQDKAYTESVNLRNFKLARYNSTKPVFTNYLLFTPRLAKSYLQALVLEDKDLLTGTRTAHVGWRGVNIWMIVGDLIHSGADTPFCFGDGVPDGYDNYEFGGGTSVVLNSPWSMAAKKRGYHFINMQYCTLNSPAADYTGTASISADTVYYFRNSTVTLNSPACEIAYSRLVRVEDSSKITLTNPDFFLSINGTGIVADALIESSGRSTLKVSGGRLRSTAAAVNAMYRAIWSGELILDNVSDSSLDSGTSYTYSRSENATTKSQICVHSLSTVDRKYGSAEETFTSIGGEDRTSIRKILDYDADLKISGGLNVGYVGNVGSINYDWFGWNTGKLRLGRHRIWNDGSNLRVKTDSDPASAKDGAIVNAMRSNSDTLLASTGQYYYNTTTNQPMFFDGTSFAYNNPYRGTVRPTGTSRFVGCYYLDLTLKKPIWWTGSEWVDGMGSVII